MVEKTLETLFHETLKDMYYAERKILKALPKMERAAAHPDLKAAFEKHRMETEVQVERLQQVFEIFGKRAQGKTCDAIEGIIAEAEQIMDDFKGQPAIDAGLASSAQAVEHYEIARYGTLARWAGDLGLKDAKALLVATLNEEEATDKALTTLAEASLNPSAKAA
ncbi:YciE/YciF ferroxidase family protein [Phyllobacterium chamaecytisi]|uniref:YciE/YciF ferroxidase family protein n=1 Tax=Phyllobacterium chamaecytisi TaxID=2876082 RepID=UPI001CCDA1B1|nr:ferritin-like domain-containing protein [Phyllobacterium sp. KW56]MBZ9605802.1 ferritin-like domain-containing protein [Phyllobacterium sp. KW56]